MNRLYNERHMDCGENHVKVYNEGYLCNKFKYIWLLYMASSVPPRVVELIESNGTNKINTARFKKKKQEYKIAQNECELIQVKEQDM